MSRQSGSKFSIPRKCSIVKVIPEGSPIRRAGPTPCSVGSPSPPKASRRLPPQPHSRHGGAGTPDRGVRRRQSRKASGHEPGARCAITAASRRGWPLDASLLSHSPAGPRSGDGRPARRRAIPCRVTIAPDEREAARGSSVFHCNRGLAGQFGIHTDPLPGRASQPHRVSQSLIDTFLQARKEEALLSRRASPTAERSRSSSERIPRRTRSVTRPDTRWAPKASATRLPTEGITHRQRKADGLFGNCPFHHPPDIKDGSADPPITTQPLVPSELGRLA